MVPIRFDLFHCRGKRGFLLEIIDAGHFTERRLRVEVERIQDESRSVIGTDLPVSIAKRNSHLEGTVKQKKSSLEKFLTSLFYELPTTLPLPFFHWVISYSLHCAKLPSGSRPHPEIAP